MLEADRKRITGGFATPVERMSPEFLFAQVLFLRNTLFGLKLDAHIQVSETPEVRSAEWFANKKALGLVGTYETPVVILTSSEDRSIPLEQRQVCALYVTPTPEGSGLLVDDATGTVWTDSFWICEGGILKYIKPTQPVPLDGLERPSDSWREGIPYDKGVRLYEWVADQKYLTKGVLENNGIAVPKGVGFLPENAGQVASIIDNFFTANPYIRDIVVKSNFDSGGTRVLLMKNTSHDLKMIAPMIERWISEYKWAFILEERIRPFPANRYVTGGRFAENGDVDYNFRVLVTIDRENPQVIDSEVRFRSQSTDDNPVNIGLDAIAARVSELALPSELEEKVYKTAKEAVQAMAELTLDPGEMVLGYSGVDLIFDQNGDVYVFEVNGTRSGGLSTLCRLDGKPLESVHSRLIPAYIPKLTENYAKRVPLKAVTLRRLPHNRSDIQILEYKQSKP